MKAKVDNQILRRFKHFAGAMLTEQEPGHNPHRSTPTTLTYLPSGQMFLDFTEDCYSCGQGVAVEVYRGVLRVIVWADPESEDPTHTINIEKSKLKGS